MKSHISHKTRAGSGESSGWLDRFFSQLEKFAYVHPYWVILASLALAGLSLWYTAAHLQFNASRRELVSKDLPYEKLYERYRQEFADFEGITVVAEGTDPAEMRNFIEGLAVKVRAHSSIYSEVLYKIDAAYFKDKALLYMDLPELKALGEKIESRRDFIDNINRAPGLNRLLQGINSEISAGMVDVLLSDFLGSPEESEKEKERDDPAGLGLLVSLLKQMSAHLQGETRYSSPWLSFLSNHEESLRDEGYMVSKDGALMFMLLSPRATQSSFDESKRAIDTVRQLIRELKPGFPHVHVGVTGSDVIASDEMQTTRADVSLSAFISLMGVSLLFIVVYRGIVKPLLAVFCLIVALCWAMGFTTLTIGHLNILSIVSVTVLIGLGVDFGIHVLERYREEKASGGDILSALQQTLRKTGRGNLAGAIITALAFLAMSFTDFTGIAELGMICGGGILLCFIAMIVLLPALVTLEEKWRGKNLVDPKPTQWNGHVERFFDHYVWIIAVSGVLLALSVFAFARLHFDYNLLNLQARGTEAVEFELKIINNASHSTWYAAAIADSYEDARKKQRIIQAMPSVGKVESALSAIPENQEEKIEYVRTLAPLLDRLEAAPENGPLSLGELTETLNRIRFKMREREGEKGGTDRVGEAGRLAQQLIDDLEKTDPKIAKERLLAFSGRLFEDYRGKLHNLKASAHPAPVKIEELPPLLKKRFLSKDGKYLLQVYPKINIWERDAMEEFLAQMRKVDPEVTGNAVHMYESSQLMKNGYIHGGIYALGAIVVFILFMFRNMRTAFFILTPKLVGSVWTVGLMYLLNVQFNLANLIILPLISGIGLVNGIHIVHRYREETDNHISVLSKSTGQGVILSSVATMIGFGSLMVADHRGIHSLGLLLTLGVGSSLAASVTLLPAMLRLCYVKGWKV